MRRREPHRISSEHNVTDLITEYISICLYVSACACVRASSIPGDSHSSSLSDDVILDLTQSIVAFKACKIARIHRRKNGKIFRVTTQEDVEHISTNVLTGTNVTLTDRGEEEFVISAEPRSSPRPVYEIDQDSSGCSVDMAEGSAEEEQSSTAAPASPPADLRTLNTQLTTPYHHRHLQPPPRLHPRHQSNMLATAAPLRHSHNSMLSHQVNTETDMDAPCELPLNLKNEDSDRSSVGSPEPGSGAMHEHRMLLESSKNSRKRRRSVSPENMSQAKRAAEAQAHLNGTMASMVTLQNLQNLANLQNLPQVASLAAGLQSMSASLTNSQLINTPLNLTVSSSAGTLPTASSTTTVPHLLPPSSAPMATLPQLLSQPQPVAMPQFILTSGQLVQGIQGAQLLIPTSQGIATQTILTIPVSHVTNNQMVNLALSNGQVVSTTLANLQSIAAPQTMMNAPANNVPTSPNLASGLGLNHAALPHLLGNSSANQQLLNAIQPQLLQAVQAAQASQQPLLTTSLHQRSHQHTSHMNHYASLDKHHRDRPEQSSPMNGPVVSASSALNRLAASNGEITITTTHGPGGGSGLETSPSSVHSPKDDDDDLLSDSPNQLTINDATNNVADVGNLAQIKEFAKAFKQRRVSMGLTQTQVGQALSVTEGPAYSQSAICSALATQMYAATQIASQHQAMFEKLDITPKSAQKIKPVLARWMKEAEERYKSGANHLTEFIGAEPSKKRKRRTSFTPQALELLNAHFDTNTHPSGNEITQLAQQLGYEREVIRIWFCNKRQSLKNTLKTITGVKGTMV
ncbi:POU domain, class 6, transcription factor 1 isoform X2 [Venturia canescens]|uniref:POU domain, class 6, transcription factor 1 isoform X2 n=1 Tax=Venturia canescens TaxID=32260 RepID=UPI001C9C1F84|nr:POU domain, class 6, transcription factor 1 isoform X2 [Venturia canescens]